MDTGILVGGGWRMFIEEHQFSFRHPAIKYDDSIILESIVRIRDFRIDGVQNGIETTIWTHCPRHKAIRNVIVAGFVETAMCEYCGERLSWWCPDSPDHACHYDNGDYDQCDFCGQPEERK